MKRSRSSPRATTADTSAVTMPAPMPASKRAQSADRDPGVINDNALPAIASLHRRCCAAARAGLRPNREGKRGQRGCDRFHADEKAGQRLNPAPAISAPTTKGSTKALVVEISWAPMVGMKIDLSRRMCRAISSPVCRRSTSKPLLERRRGWCVALVGGCAVVSRS